MEGILRSFEPIFSRLRAEIILIAIAICIALFSLGMYLFQARANQPEKTVAISAEQPQKRQDDKQQYVSVDVSGAVLRPGVYQFTVLSRFNDALQKAGGLAEDADKAYVERNFNLARILTDQEKIYVPLQADTANGMVEENKRILDYSQPAIVTTQTEEQEKAKIDINLATIDELDTLTGIGKVQGDAIIKSRPYQTTDELVTKNILRSSVYEKIKDQIIAQ